MIILAAGLAYYPPSCPFGAIAWFQDCIMVRIRRSAVGSPGDQVPDLPSCDVPTAHSQAAPSEKKKSLSQRLDHAQKQEHSLI